MRVKVYIFIVIASLILTTSCSQEGDLSNHLHNKKPHIPEFTSLDPNGDRVTSDELKYHDVIMIIDYGDNSFNNTVIDLISKYEVSMGKEIPKKLFVNSDSGQTFHDSWINISDRRLHVKMKSFAPETAVILFKRGYLHGNVIRNEYYPDKLRLSLYLFNHNQDDLRDYILSTDLEDYFETEELYKKYHLSNADNPLLLFIVDDIKHSSNEIIFKTINNKVNRSQYNHIIILSHNYTCRDVPLIKENFHVDVELHCSDEKLVSSLKKLESHNYGHIFNIVLAYNPKGKLLTAMYFTDIDEILSIL